MVTINAGIGIDLGKTSGMCAIAFFFLGGKEEKRINNPTRAKCVYWRPGRRLERSYTVLLDDVEKNFFLFFLFFFLSTIFSQSYFRSLQLTAAICPYKKE